MVTLDNGALIQLAFDLERLRRWYYKLFHPIRELKCHAKNVRQ
jgi:hypothetical protein